MSKLTTVIFDMDGTLADTEEVHRQAFNLAFDDFNLDWHWSRKEYTELLKISGGRERMRQYALDCADFKMPPDLDDYVAGIHKLKTNHYGRMLTEGHIRLRPGVLRLLNECRDAGLDLAIATSSQLVNVKTLLDNNLPADWQSWFEVIATCDVIDAKKPSPAVYLFVLDKMGVDPVNCLAVEDTRNGLLSARAAGLKTLITTHYFTRYNDFEDAPLVVDTLGEPDAHFTVAAGDASHYNYVTVDLLRYMASNNPTPMINANCA